MGVKVDYETHIPISSKLVGKTIGEISKKFPGISIDHCHNSPINVATRVFSEPNLELKAGMSIKIDDLDPKTLAEFLKWSGLL